MYLVPRSEAANALVINPIAIVVLTLVVLVLAGLLALCFVKTRKSLRGKEARQERDRDGVIKGWPSGMRPNPDDGSPPAYSAGDAHLPAYKARSLDAHDLDPERSEMGVV